MVDDPTGPGRSLSERPWIVRHHHGDATELHALTPPDGTRREVWVCAVDEPSLVLGSTQPAGDVDPQAAADRGVVVGRRRSGGGAVLLRSDTVWIDAFVPRGDPLWAEDVGLAFGWFGEAWARALVSLGLAPEEVRVHVGALVSTTTSPVVCFAGLGPGEVTVGEAKAVGLSQRRTRELIRLQSSLAHRWEPQAHAALLAPGLRRVAPSSTPTTAMEQTAVLGWGEFAPDPMAVVDEVLRQLPTT